MNQKKTDETVIHLENPLTKYWESNLPAGWELAKDPASGKTYYFNRAQNLTSWTVPTE